MESKQNICDLLFEAIRRTNAGEDLTALKYVKDGDMEFVYADFIDAPAARRINVTIDSGWAMIKDIVNHLDIG